ncbi:hypothetical protein GW846_05540 [Candidatus Gracilibacteria bacterium]|nr:hypothetical protein [Candidatus Gracilibacteria bacterium]
MKKIITSLFTLGLFMAFLLVPIFLMLQSAHMNHGDVNNNNCISHCLVSTDSIQESTVNSLFVYQEFIISVTVFHSLLKQDIFISAFLIFFLIFAPPNVWRVIKNYQYHSLVGVVKLLN